MMLVLEPFTDCIDFLTCFTFESDYFPKIFNLKNVTKMSSTRYFVKGLDLWLVLE